MLARKAVPIAAISGYPTWPSAHTYAPLVAMRVTTPDGTTQDISARERSVATLTLETAGLRFSTN